MDLCGGRKSAKIKPSREFDIYFDPTLFFPSRKDYTREMNKAAVAATTFVVRPCFDTMFSDTRPRHQLVFKQSPLHFASSTRDTHSKICTNSRPNIEVLGARRPMFFKQPVTKPRPPSNIQIQLQSVTACDVLAEPRRPIQKTPPCSHKVTQTDYRESEAQTDPWCHDVIAVQDIALAQLGWFNVDQRRPIGKREISLLEGHWQKQAWDAVVPQMDLISTWQRNAMTHVMAANDTAAKDADVDADNARRLLLSVKNLVNHLTASRRDLQERLQRLAILLKTNRAGTVSYLKHQLSRNLRKLSMKHRGIDMKYQRRLPRDVLGELMDKTSELNAPQLRFGEQPESRLKETESQYQHLQFLPGLELVEKRVGQSPKTSTRFNFELNAKPKGETCRRISSQVEKELIQYKEFKHVGVSGKDAEGSLEPGLLKLRESYYVDTPTEDDAVDWVEEQEQFNILLNKVIQGRATQTQMMEGDLK